MKNEADKVFNAQSDLNPNIITGHALQGQFEIVEHEASGQVESVLEFWLHPALAEEFDGNEHLSGADNSIKRFIVLEDGDDPQEAFKALDKAMIYLFALQGINDAKIMRDRNDQIVLQPVEYTLLDVKDAMNVAADIYGARKLLHSQAWTVQTGHQILKNYFNAMELGECTLQGNVISFPDFCEPEPAQPDVTVTIHNDATMTLSYDNSVGESVAEMMPFDYQGMIDMMTRICKLGVLRGLTEHTDFDLFTNVFMVMDGRSPEALIQDIVPVKDDDPLHAAALQAFLEMDTPKISDLN